MEINSGSEVKNDRMLTIREMINYGDLTNTAKTIDINIHKNTFGFRVYDKKTERLIKIFECNFDALNWILDRAIAEDVILCYPGVNLDSPEKERDEPQNSEKV